MNLDDYYLEIRSPNLLQEGNRTIRMWIFNTATSVRVRPPIELCHYSVDWYLSSEWKRTLIMILLEDNRMERFRWERKFVQLRAACAASLCGVKLPSARTCLVKPN